MASTLFTLMAEFETGNVPLEDICEKYFGLSIAQANRRADICRLPVPTFRCGTQKSKRLVSVIDLAKYIDQQREKAAAEWDKMNAD